MYKKILEECNELVSSKTSDDIIEEAGDVFEGVSAISELEGRNIDEVKSLIEWNKFINISPYNEDMY